MAITLSKYNLFVDDLLKKLHNLNSDTINVVLTNTAPTVATDHVYTDVANELATSNGYTQNNLTGGAAVASASSGTDTVKTTSAITTLTASGAVGPFRYAIVLNNTATNKNLIGYYDYASSVTMANGDTFTITGTNTTGLFTLA